MTKAKPQAPMIELPKEAPDLLPENIREGILSDSQDLLDEIAGDASSRGVAEADKPAFDIAEMMREVNQAIYRGVQIAIPSNMEHLPSYFVDNLSGLQKPAVFVQDIIREATIDGMRNAAVELMLASTIRHANGVSKLGHLFMLDNDMIYPSNTLMTMLGDKVDVVAGWACQRARPFYHNFLTPCDQGLYEVRKVLPTPPGLHEVGAVGACGMLIKREVLEAIEPPWFAFDTDEETGKPIGEDVYFCRKARKAGFKIYCRTDLRFGHMVTSLAFPNHDDDGNYTPEIQHGIY